LPLSPVASSFRLSYHGSFRGCCHGLVSRGQLLKAVADIAATHSTVTLAQYRFTLHCMMLLPSSSLSACPVKLGPIN